MEEKVSDPEEYKMVFLPVPAGGMPQFFAYPRYLLSVTDLNETEKLLYILLLDRTMLSAKNKEWRDVQGHIFCCFTIEHLAERAHRGVSAVKSSLSELEDMGMIERKKRGIGRPDRIYVKKPCAGALASYSWRTEFFSDAGLDNYMMYPKFLLDYDLSETARLVYVLLLDRSRMSERDQTGNFRNRAGAVFCYFPTRELAGMIHRSASTVKISLARLTEANLIFRDQQWMGRPSRIYPLLPVSVEAPGTYITHKGHETGSENEDGHDSGGLKTGHGWSEIQTSKGQETGPGMVRNPAAIKNKGINNYPNKMNERWPTGPPDDIDGNDDTRGNAPARYYGWFKNVCLSDADMAVLQKEFPYDWKEKIEHLSTYMVSRGKTYENHLATILDWAHADQRENEKKKKNNHEKYKKKGGNTL